MDAELVPARMNLKIDMPITMCRYTNEDTNETSE